MKRLVTIHLGQLAQEALRGAAGLDRVPSATVQAVRCYLNDRGSGAPGWSYPAFLPEPDLGQGVDLQLSIDADLWGCLEKEAGSQGVSVQQMVDHAALYFAAEVDAGRLTKRILEELEDGAA